jgi:hypothetical protein
LLSLFVALAADFSSWWRETAWLGGINVGFCAVVQDKSAEQASVADRVAFELLARQRWTATDRAELHSVYAGGLRNDAWSNRIRAAAAHCASEKLMLEIAALPLPAAADVSGEKDFRKLRALARIDFAPAALLPSPKGQLLHQ